MKLDLDLLERVTEITRTDYKGELNNDIANTLIEELLDEIDHLKEELEDSESRIKNAIEDEYIKAEMRNEWMKDRLL